MADTTKALEALIAKMEKEYAGGKALAAKIRVALDAKIMEFHDAGYKDHLVGDDPAAKKMQADKFKLQHAYDAKYAELTGLKTKIEKAQAAKDDYVKNKADLKLDKRGGAIDKDEYSRRKKLFKSALDDIGTVNEAEIRQQNDDVEGKKKSLAALGKQAKDARATYVEAKKFVDGGLAGNAKDVAEKCDEYFGKRNLNPKEAAKALGKVEDAAKELEKEQRILQTEVDLIEKKIDEAMDRFKKFQKDIERSKVSYENGDMEQEELDRVMANFKTTLAIK